MRLDNFTAGIQPPCPNFNTEQLPSRPTEAKSNPGQPQGTSISFGNSEQGTSLFSPASGQLDSATLTKQLSILKSLMELLSALAGGKNRDAGEQARPNAMQAVLPLSGTGQQAAVDGGVRPVLKQSEKDVSSKPTASTGRPDGDNRSADEIIEANPILKNLGSQKDINREGAYKQLGDWTANNKDPEARADAAYNAAKVLNYIDTSQGADGKDRSQVSGKGDLYGITKDGDARHGTPAGNWKDFTEKGYGALKDDHRLDKTNDPWVYKDGTNKSEFKGAITNIGQKLAFIPGLSNVLKGMGESQGGFFDTLGGAFKGVAQTWKNNAEGAIDSIQKGKITPNQLLFGAYMGNIKNSEDIPREAKEAAEKL